jgi:tRNA G18 (ribose-2'-O)-methylase SpoU
VVACVSKPTVNWNSTLLRIGNDQARTPLLVVLDRVQDPGNTGM